MRGVALSLSKEVIATVELTALATNLIADVVFDRILVAGQLPSDHVAVTKVLRWLSIPVLSTHVNDFDDFVDKDYNLVRQTLSGVTELADAADRVNYFDLLAGERKVHSSFCLGQRLGYDGST